MEQYIFHVSIYIFDNVIEPEKVLFNLNGICSFKPNMQNRQMTYTYY